MIAKSALDAEQRVKLLEDLQRLRSDADQLDSRHLLERFLPLPAHERALSRDIMVVRGERGSGKSMLFKTLAALSKEGLPTTELFGQADDALAVWVEGFSEGGTAHPHTDLSRAFHRERDGNAVVDELARIGVLRARENKRWDVPDIYRYGYEIKRKGGVARPR